MSRRPSSDDVVGTLLGLGALYFFAPTWLWVVVGIGVAVPVVCWLGYLVYEAAENNREAARVRAREEEAARAAAAQREREEHEERVRREKQRRIDTLGQQNAGFLDSALKAVKQVADSEAARTGWLPDVDFGPDIAAITGNFEKAHSLRLKASKLSAMDKPAAEDLRLLAEAQSTIANLERIAIARAELIGKCAREAHLIDESLRCERKDAQTAAQRAELHAELSAELYGIEAVQNTAPTVSAADAVMARVEAYREIKNQIQQAREIAP